MRILLGSLLVLLFLTGCSGQKNINSFNVPEDYKKYSDVEIKDDMTFTTSKKITYKRSVMKKRFNGYLNNEIFKDNVTAYNSRRSYKRNAVDRFKDMMKYKEQR